MTDFSRIPSVDKLLQTKPASRLVFSYGRPLVLASIRQILDDIRNTGIKSIAQPFEEEIFRMAEDLLTSWTAPTLIPVINATGVILHTNLGRAPLSTSALEAMQLAARGYSTLEYDLERGERGSRSLHAEKLLTRLTGTEAAMVVNNNAGAVLLVLSCLAKRQRVIVSRTQLVEIGGGFRVPDVMIQSGAKLVEIGTTNRVHLKDYQKALEEKTAVVMRAHHSNFKLVGFTEEPSLVDIVSLAHQHEALVVDDLGSGALLDTSRFGMAHEPTIQESMQAGVDLVCFSGDKLLGGPQAGIIIGRKKLVEKIKRHPLARAVRADKLCLAGLCGTLEHYLRDEAEQKIPIWMMIAKEPEEIRLRAIQWTEALGTGKVIEGKSTVGGGSLPEETIPTFLLAIETKNADQFAARLRKANPPIIARIENDQVVLDPRTVLAEQEATLLGGLLDAMKLQQKTKR